jgi:hypothetical protein
MCTNNVLISPPWQPCLSAKSWFDRFLDDDGSAKLLPLLLLVCPARRTDRIIPCFRFCSNGRKKKKCYTTSLLSSVVLPSARGEPIPFRHTIVYGIKLARQSVSAVHLIMAFQTIPFHAAASRHLLSIRPTNYPIQFTADAVRGRSKQQ